jgi:magnesium-transporting ATPase (P-type)
LHTCASPPFPLNVVALTPAFNNFKNAEMPSKPASFVSIRGLSAADAQARLKNEGYNELPRPDRRTPLRIIFEVVREPMLALLLGHGVIYLALGDLKEALILLAFATTWSMPNC